MALGMEVGLGPGDFVFVGDPVAPRTEGTPTTTQFFGPCLLWPNDWMDEDPTWYGSRPRPRPRSNVVLDGVPALRERDTAAPLFSSHVYCGHGRPSQLLLSSCSLCNLRELEAYDIHTYSVPDLGLQCGDLGRYRCAVGVVVSLITARSERR